MAIPYYPGSTITPNLGLSLVGMDEVIAEDFVLLDAAVGGATGTPGGTTGQVQYNDAGAFGGIAEGTAGEVLTSNGVGVPPSFQPGGSSGTFPITFAAVTHEWLNSYSSVTGLFTATQPAYTDISGTPQLAQTFALVTSEFLTSYNATTGLFTAAQPTYAGISGTPQLAQTFAPVANEFVTGYSAVTGLFSAAQPSYANISGTPQLPVTIAKVTHEWLDSYSSVTGLFTQSQPAYTDISGTPQLATTFAPVTNEFVTGYSAATGLFTAAQPTYAGISGTPQLPITIAKVAHEWLDSYSSVTGLFTQSQPAYTDISGTPQLATTFAPVTNEFLTGYTASTGVFTAAQPTYANISGTPQLAQTFAAVAHEWINSYSATTGLFTATQPAASDLSNGTTGTGAVVLAGSPAITGTMSVVNESISGTLADGTASVGTSGQVLSSTGTGTLWVAASSGSGTVTSVSFTGGLISVATPTTTPALTVAGTSGGIPYFSSASTWATSAALTANSPILGGGAATAPSTKTFLTTNGTTTLTIGVVGGGNGILALGGTTSGTATFTAPSVAGTRANAVTSSNTIGAPTFVAVVNGGTASLPSFALGTVGGFYTDTAGAADVLAFAIGGVTPFGIGNGASGSNVTTWASTAVAGWASAANTHAVLDTGISRLAAASLAFGNGTAGDITAAVTMGTPLTVTSAGGPLIIWNTTNVGAAARNWCIGLAQNALGDFCWRQSTTQGGSASSGTIIAGFGPSAGLYIGAPTGTDEGAGTINVATGYYVNGTAGVSAGPFTAVTSITTVKGLVTVLSGTSDERLKIAEPYEGGLDELQGINPIRFKWNAKGQAQTGLSGEQYFVGFLAQNVQAVIPEAITATEQSKDGTETYLSLDDRPILALAVNAIKELSALRAVDRLEIDSLRAEMQQMKEDLQKLKGRY
jgi:hypothetical protein